MTALTPRQLIDLELTPLRLLQDIVPPILRARAMAATDFEDVQGRTALLQALHLHLESLVLQLNASIDGLILAIYLRSRGMDITPQDTRRSRREWLQSLEARFAFDESQLPGAAQVSSVNRTANSIKHRAGLEFGSTEGSPLDIASQVLLDEHLVDEYFAGAFSWMLAVAEACWDPPAASSPPNSTL